MIERPNDRMIRSSIQKLNGTETKHFNSVRTARPPRASVRIKTKCKGKLFLSIRNWSELQGPPGGLTVHRSFVRLFVRLFCKGMNGRTDERRATKWNIRIEFKFQIYGRFYFVSLYRPTPQANFFIRFFWNHFNFLGFWQRGPDPQTPRI